MLEAKPAIIAAAASTPVPATYEQAPGLRETGVNTITSTPTLDWMLGAVAHAGPATISLACVDARYRGRKGQDHHGGSIVAAVTFNF